MHCLLCKFGDGVEVEARYILRGYSLCEHHVDFINNRYDFIIPQYKEYNEYISRSGSEIPE